MVNGWGVETSRSNFDLQRKSPATYLNLALSAEKFAFSDNLAILMVVTDSALAVRISVEQKRENK